MLDGKQTPRGRLEASPFAHVLALAATGAVAQPREPDVADHRIAVVEGHDLSGPVPMEAHRHSA